MPYNAGIQLLRNKIEFHRSYNKPEYHKKCNNRHITPYPRLNNTVIERCAPDCKQCNKYKGTQKSYFRSIISVVADDTTAIGYKEHNCNDKHRNGSLIFGLYHGGSPHFSENLYRYCTIILFQLCRKIINHNYYINNFSICPLTEYKKFIMHYRRYRYISFS